MNNKPQYKLLLEQNPDAIIFSNVQGNITFWNSAASTLFGFSESEALGKNLDIIIPDRFRAAHWKGFESAIKNKKTKYANQAMATRAQGKDGSQFYIEMSFSIILNDKGEVEGALAQSRNIHERYIKEKELKKRLAELESLG